MPDSIRQIDAAIIAHDQWKTRLLAAIEAGSSDFTTDQVRVDNLCAFGKWFYSAAPDLVASPHYGRVRELHALFHKAAGEVLALALSGDRAGAQTALGFGEEYVTASVRLVDELEWWKADLRKAQP